VLFNNFKFPPPAALVSTSAPGTVIAAACAQHHESGIVVQYANQNSEEQLRELEHLDAQFTLRRTSSESTTDPSGSPDLVGHVVLAGAAPPASHSFSLASQPRRTISDGLPFAERSNCQSAAACVPSNGPPTDPDRLSRLFDTGTVTSTLYVERLPLDATEREVAHIFRPFPGFMSVRVRPTTSKRNPSMRFLLCFVEFDVPRNAAIALDARQGYQLSACDERGLKITFASRAARLNRFAVTQ
jgi:hypothetical protein